MRAGWHTSDKEGGCNFCQRPDGPYRVFLVQGDTSGLVVRFCERCVGEFIRAHTGRDSNTGHDPKQVNDLALYVAKLPTDLYDRFVDEVSPRAAKTLYTLAHAIEHVEVNRRREEVVDGEGYFIVSVGDGERFRRTRDDIIDGPYDARSTELQRTLTRLRREPRLVWDPAKLRIAKYTVEGSTWALVDAPPKPTPVDHRRTYRGQRDPDIGNVKVTVNDSPLDMRTDALRLSPSGYDWGYAGNGPSQLAFAILCDHLTHHPGDIPLTRRINGTDEGAKETRAVYWASRTHGHLRRAFLEPMQDATWVLTSDMITSYLRAQAAEMPG